ncbi:MAG: Uma2 family endonuclease [Planctomycetota bacterium]|nr:Uma2 family endonuclease [Planctomycetota bacterium]
MSTATRLTYADYCALPDDGARYELLAGELVMMAPAPTPRHQKVVAGIAHRLTGHVESKRLGTVLFAPLDVILTEQEVVQPDIVFISKAREGIIREKGIFGAPDLCVEVLSPSTREKDLTVKRELYTRHGVVELWYVDLEARRVELYRPREEPTKPQTYFYEKDALVSPLLPGFELALEPLFKA